MARILERWIVQHVPIEIAEQMIRGRLLELWDITATADVLMEHVTIDREDAARVAVEWAPLSVLSEAREARLFKQRRIGDRWVTVEGWIVTGDDEAAGIDWSAPHWMLDAALVRPAGPLLGERLPTVAQVTPRHLRGRRRRAGRG
jgi:hypothetical protein